MNKKYLIINRYSPLDGLYCEEILELALTIASLEQEVSLLLSGSGLLSLLSNYNYQLLDRVSLHQILQAFELFEFNHIYVEAKVLEQIYSFGFSLSEKFTSKVVAFDWSALTDLCHKYDIIWFF